MTTERVSKIINEVIEQQQVGGMEGGEQFVKLEHDGGGGVGGGGAAEADAQHAFKPLEEVEEGAELQLNQLFSASPLHPDDKADAKYGRRGQTVVEGGRPMKRTYLLLKEFNSEEDWRRFYVTEMEHWAKKRVAKHCVEYECRLKRKGCKMALRLINGNNGRPSKALIAAGEHDHSMMRPTFSDDVRSIIDRCIEENYNVKPLFVCETLKDAGFPNVSRKQVHHYLQRIRKCDEESYSITDGFTIQTQPVEQSISLLSASHQSYATADNPAPSHYQEQKLTLSQPQPDQSYSISQTQVFSQPQIIYTNPTVQALISALPGHGAAPPGPPGPPPQLQQVIAHNPVLRAPILVHPGPPAGLDDGRGYLVQQASPAADLSKPTVFAVTAQKVEVQQVGGQVHLIKIYP